MKRVFIFLPLLAAALGCTLSGGSLASPPDPTKPTPPAWVTSTPAPTLTPSQVSTQAAPTALVTSTPAACHVRTGIDSGLLYMRACGSMHCAVLAVLEEGAGVIITQPGVEWSAIRAGELAGWAASRYLECKP